MYQQFHIIAGRHITYTGLIEPYLFLSQCDCRYILIIEQLKISYFITSEVKCVSFSCCLSYIGINVSINTFASVYVVFLCKAAPFRVNYYKAFEQSLGNNPELR